MSGVGDGGGANHMLVQGFWHGNGHSTIIRVRSGGHRESVHAPNCSSLKERRYRHRFNFWGFSVAKDNSEFYWICAVVTIITSSVLHYIFGTKIAVNVSHLFPLRFSLALLRFHYNEEFFDETFINHAIVVVIHMNSGESAAGGRIENLTHKCMAASN
jgi:hypothetical protein